MVKIILIYALMMLFGCASTSLKEYKSPDGLSIKSVKCKSEKTKCFEQATQSCPGEGSYRILASESHAGGLVADIMPGPVTWYSMTFECGPSDGKMPDFKFTGERYTPSTPRSEPPAPLDLFEAIEVIETATGMGHQWGGT